MQTALYQLAEDFLSTIVFLIAYFATGNLYLAVILAIVVGVGQFVLLKRRGRTLDAMGWLSLGFAIALGGATLITDDSRFIMAKPSVIHFAIAVVMLRPGWLKRYMPDVVRENVPERVLVASGYAWAALMIVLGLANLVIASAKGPLASLLRLHEGFRLVHEDYVAAVFVASANRARKRPAEERADDRTSSSDVRAREVEPNGR